MSGTVTVEAEAQTVADTAVVDDETSFTGRSIGRYVVVAEVGRGGMGRVLRAYDPKLQREVAVKVVHEAALGTEGAQRLVAEARAMARLSHPNVVAVYDVELVDGRVHLVMEYVGGSTLRHWLANSARTWEEILPRFIAAGRGLSAAHASGMLHRDFKPANVLVDEDAVKVTDFGLAKSWAGDARSSLDSRDLRASSVDASFEAQTATGVVLGTPRYMAPEQHTGASLSAGTDQYAFCVALWEALCRQPPFRGKNLVRDKLRGPGDWPAGDVPMAIAAAVKRGLHPDPVERWSSVDALLVALRRAATAPRRRRRMILSGVAALGVGVAVTAIGLGQGRDTQCSGADEALGRSWNDDRRARVQRAILDVEAPYAATTWSTIDARLDAYAEDWKAMHRDTCESTSVRGEQSAAVMDLRMACLQRASLTLDAVTAVLAEVDSKSLGRAQRVLRTLPPLSQCADVDRLQRDVARALPEEAAAVDAARGRISRARAAVYAGKTDDSLARIREATTALEGVSYGPIRTELAEVEGFALEQGAEYDRARRRLEECVVSAVRWEQDETLFRCTDMLAFVTGVRLHEPDAGLAHESLLMGLAADDLELRARVHSTMGAILHEAGREEEAVTRLRTSIDLYRRADDVHPRHGVYSTLANTLAGLGRSREALEIRDEALRRAREEYPPGHPELIMTLVNRASTLHSAGQWDEAEAQMRDALELEKAALGDNHPSVAASLANLARMLSDLRRHDEAVELNREALAILLDHLDANHPRVATVRANLAESLGQSGDNEASLREHRKALASRRAWLGDEHPDIAYSLAATGQALHRDGRSDEAHEKLQEAAALFAKTLGANHPMRGGTLYGLGQVDDARGNHEAAASYFAQALAVFESSVGSEHPHVQLARTALAGERLRSGDLEEARRLIEDAWKARQSGKEAPAALGETAFVMARVMWAQGEREESLDVAERALELLRDSSADATAEVEEWIAEHPRPAQDR